MLPKLTVDAEHAKDEKPCTPLNTGSLILRPDPSLQQPRLLIWEVVGL